MKAQLDGAAGGCDTRPRLTPAKGACQWPRIPIPLPRTDRRDPMSGYCWTLRTGPGTVAVAPCGWTITRSWLTRPIRKIGRRGGPMAEAKGSGPHTQAGQDRTLRRGRGPTGTNGRSVLFRGPANRRPVRHSVEQGGGYPQGPGRPVGHGLPSRRASPFSPRQGPATVRNSLT